MTLATSQPQWAPLTLASADEGDTEGSQGTKSMARRASGTQRARSCKRRTARLPMTPAAVPIRCSSLRSNDQAFIDWLLGGTRKLIFPTAGSLSCTSVNEPSSRVSLCVSQKPRSVYDGPKATLANLGSCQKMTFVFDVCQVCASKTAHWGDCRLRCARALMALCR